MEQAPRRRPQLALLAAATVLLAVTAWIAWSLGAGARSEATAPEAAGASAAAAVEPELAEVAGEALALEALRVEQAVAPQPTLEPERAIVRGRCVAAESGAPLAGCTVAFSGQPRNPGVQARHGPAEWSDPEPLVTGADGRFEIRFAPPPPYQHSLDVSALGRAPRSARWSAFAPGQVEDLGDVELALGWVVEGQVIDETAAPVPEVVVSLKGLPSPVRDDMAARSSRSGRSQATGWFRIDAPIPAGTWSLDAGARGLKLVSPDRVTVREGLGAEPVTVIVRRMPSISGVVVDETGAGVGGVRVQAELRKRAGRMAAARTDESGRFTIHAVDDELYPVRLAVSDPGPCEPPEEPGGEVEWGASDVRIALSRALSLELEVVERGTGAPVEEFAVVCYAERARSSLQRDARLGGHHPGGRVTVDKVWRGPTTLQVLPNDPALAPGEAIAFEARAPLAPLRVELERRVLRRVRVTTAESAPVEGSRVELVRTGSQALEAQSPVIDRARGGMSFGGRPDRRPHELLAEAVTDEAGGARVHVADDASGLGLRVTGAEHLPLVVPDVVFPAEGALELVVATGGRIAGSLRLEGYEPTPVLLLFEPLDPAWRSRGLEPAVTLDASGRFESPSLAPGAYGLRIALEHDYRTEGGGGGSRLVLERELATALVEADRTTELALDGRALAPARVAGIVRIDGAASDACRVFLELVGERTRTRFGQYVPDAHGRFEARGLPPGTWRVGAVVGDYKSGQGDLLRGAETFELAPGELLERAFDLARRRLTLRLLGPDGVTPLAEADVLVLGDASPLMRRTDAQGRLTLDPAPAGALRVTSGNLFGGPVEPPPGLEPAELDVVLRPL